MNWILNYSAEAKIDVRGFNKSHRSDEEVYDIAAKRHDKT